ncbi:MAG: hypothetical protein N2Z72_07890 [Bacteroidales bacterium]|nr:hypothetical protein [Bacteroidales bacterium]
MKKLLFLSCVIFCLQLNLWADSPLTSTDFWEAYKDVYIIQLAQSSGGQLNNELCSYLINEKNPIDVKMALINCLGWSIQGKTNSIIFLKYLSAHTNLKNEKKLKTKGSDYLLLCYAYLKAMDNYFNVQEAFEWAKLACIKNKNTSFTFAMIRSLIEAQIQLDINWCNVYKVVNEVMNDHNLLMDMREEAIEIIWAYISLYEDTC